MPTRTIEVTLSEDAARLYDVALTGHDDDVILAVEKAIVGTLYPSRVGYSLSGEYVETDPDLVACAEGEAS